MTIDLKALRALAEKATAGPWYWHEDMSDDDEHHSRTLDNDERSIVYHDADWDVDEEDRAFIAAANPATILALIRRLEAAEAVIEAARLLVQHRHTHAFSGINGIDEALHAYDQSTADDDEGKKL